MKRIFIVLLVAVLAACGEQHKDSEKISTAIVNNPLTASGVDEQAAGVKPTMDFADTTHNFGQMHEGESATYEFRFKNNGKTPLVISTAAGSCGCTVADYPKDPVPPGQSGVMKVTFNSTGKQGHQEKSVTIQANTVKNIHMLYIQAEVEGK